MEPKPATAPKQYGFGTLLLGGFILYLGYSLFDGDRARPARAPTDYCRDTTMPMIQAQSHVKARLKAPATADFPFLPNEQSYVTATGNCTFIVISYVDSQNGFGAMIRSSYGAKLKYDPAANSWELLELSME